MERGYRLEEFAHRAKLAWDDEGIKTIRDMEAYIRAKLDTRTETPEQIRAVFAEILPGLDVSYSQNDMRSRKLAHTNALNAYILIAAENGSIDRARSNPPLRYIGPVYKPEQTQADIDFNRHLRETIESQNFAELGRIYDEHIRNLPSCDPDMLQSISDVDAPQMLRQLYPLYATVQEAHKFLEENNDVSNTIRANMSQESLNRLAEMVDQMTAFSALKLRCDQMASPYYPYVDTSKITPTTENHKGTDIMDRSAPVPGMSFGLQKFIISIHNGHNNSFLQFPEDVKNLLEKANMDPDQTVLRDFSGKTYPLFTNDLTGCIDVFQRGEPLFCTFGNQLKAFRMEGSSIVEVKPKEALRDCYERALPAAVKQADNILNSDVATPRWMLTGSSEYHSMQKALVSYQKAVTGRTDPMEQSDPKVRDALESLTKATLSYFTRKGVELNDYPTFDDFRYKAEKAQTMSTRELVRMKAAYDMMHVCNSATAIENMKDELSRMPAYDRDLPVVPTYAERLAQANNAICNAAFLKDPIAPVGANNTAEALRQDLNKALADPHKGLLHKTFFTAQDRQAAEDVLARAVVLDMIRIGRKVTNSAPADIETAYMQKPEDVIIMIKNSPAFREATSGTMTPDSLRNFLIENRQASVNRSIATDAVRKNEVANEPRKQPEMQMQSNQLQM